jgi:hypothetical protein
MNNPLVSKILTAKRAELISIILDLEHKLSQSRADLAHIDATLRVFDPDYMPRQVRNAISRYPRSDYFEHGEITRSALEFLRTTTMPSATASDIAVKIMKDKGLEAGDHRMRLDFVRRILRMLQRQSEKGTIERIGRGQGVRWSLSKFSLSDQAEDPTSARTLL